VFIVVGNLVVKQQHEQSSGHVAQQVAAAIAVHRTETVDCALLKHNNTSVPPPADSHRVYAMSHSKQRLPLLSTAPNQLAVLC